MEKSALSGEMLQPNNKANIIVTFEGGRRREMAVTIEEAKELSGKGRYISGTAIDVLQTFTKPVAWLLGIIIASILVPEVTRLWADRPKELDFKNALITELSDSTAATIGGARLIMSNALPETVAANRVCAVVGQSRAVVGQSQLKEAKKECKAGRLKEVQAEQKLLNDVLDSWTRRGAVLDSKLKAYFPDSERVVIDGRAYVAIVTKYLGMATSTCDISEAHDVLNYLGVKTEADMKPLLTEPPGNDCLAKPPHYARAYSLLGDELLERRQVLVQPILTTKSDGFSTDLGDFFNRTWGFLASVGLLTGFVAIVAYLSVKLSRRSPRKSGRE